MTRRRGLQRLERDFLSEGPLMARLTAAGDLARCPGGVEVFIRVAADPACDTWARTHAIQVVPPDHPSAVGLLRRLLADPVPELRAYALDAVQTGRLTELRADVERLLGDETALELWSDEDERVSGHAREALRELDRATVTLPSIPAAADEAGRERRDEVRALIRDSALSPGKKATLLKFSSRPAASWEAWLDGVVEQMILTRDIVAISSADVDELGRLIRQFRPIP